ncbi:hypothetical protein F8M41_023492 [Gigaspora margarita]|uniref:Uncharacterized protein n=1 Tax=Gigaspora margarita TaxID=4874 RepID=A0A8H4EGW9_GIGMA|nr:hypothetical protein F8M41_023492 [Gigaspora margarita]
MDLFICNEQSSPSPITLASPIQNSAVSIDSNIVKPLVQNQSHLNIIPECYSLLIETPASGMHFNSWTKIVITLMLTVVRKIF